MQMIEQDCFINDQPSLLLMYLMFLLFVHCLVVVVVVGGGHTLQHSVLIPGSVLRNLYKGMTPGGAQETLWSIRGQIQIGQWKANAPSTILSLWT